MRLKLSVRTTSVQNLLVRLCPWNFSSKQKMSTKRKSPLSTPQPSKKVRKSVDHGAKMMVINQCGGEKERECDRTLSEAITHDCFDDFEKHRKTL